MYDIKDTLLSASVPLQDACSFITQSKYLVPGESDWDDMRRGRLAIALAAPEAEPERHVADFEWALRYAFPGGRIMANAGAEQYRPNVSTINCTVSMTIPDSMSEIMKAASEAAMTLKAGCGIGYDFTTLRPSGALVKGAGASTSGPLPFMDMFDAMCKTVSSAGGRRGAQMGVLEVSHPNIEDFVRAKREDGRLRAFNLSVNVSDAFIAAVKAGEQWPLVFPLLPVDAPDSEIIWREWPNHDPEYRYSDEGLVACKVYRRISARDLWDQIMSSTYEFSDPGFLLMSEANRMNPLWFCEDFRASNPCGEQFLPPHGACLLGSVNLAALVKNPFSPDASFDWDTYHKVITIFARMLDNVVSINKLPIQQQRDEIERKRRHGMGYLGLGSAMTMLGMKYGSPESVEFTDRVSRDLALYNWRAGLALAKEKGPAPIMTQMFTVTPSMMRKCPELEADGYQIGDSVPGRILHARYSRYMRKIAEVDAELVAELAEVGSRFSHATSIAPTGTMAASVGNNASNGIEPSFSHHYIRNMIVPGEKAKRSIPMLSYEMLVYTTLIDPTADPENPPACFEGTTSEADPRNHIAVQAAAQAWVDSSISKTCNVPTDYPFEDFKDLYMLAIDSGLKGCTTFRYNPKVHQGVLVTKDNLMATQYVFTLEDGTEVTARGDQMVEYDGGTYTAANLFDALKERLYGKH